MRYKHNGYKLICELLGSLFATEWEMNAPSVAFVTIKHSHLMDVDLKNGENILAIGSRYETGTTDINSSNIYDVTPTRNLFKQLLKIALFDCWTANEDRNDNNTNLMYKPFGDEIIPIDYGCIFNTATFDFKLSPLTYTDTILNSSLFHHLCITIDKSQKHYDREIKLLKWEYNKRVSACKELSKFILRQLPLEWGVSPVEVSCKIDELFTADWVQKAWDVFMEFISNNIKR